MPGQLLLSIPDNSTLSYYDRIAKQWHETTGYQGGSFKRHVLNDVLLEQISAVSNNAILELGAGNGYFMPLALDHFSGQIPERVVITELSTRLLAIAQAEFFVETAEYHQLDVRSQYPFDDKSFDIILATMVFNEVSRGGLKRALWECWRVLRPNGRLIITITHPTFVQSLNQRHQLRREKNGPLTMPGAGQMRLPVVPRGVEEYGRLLEKAGFSWQATDVYPTEKVLNEKAGLRELGSKPLALVLKCWR